MSCSSIILVLFQVVIVQTAYNLFQQIAFDAYRSELLIVLVFHYTHADQCLNYSARTFNVVIMSNSIVLACLAFPAAVPAQIF